MNQFNNTDKFLRDMDNGVNQQISDTAQQINSYGQQIAKLNDEITRLRGSAGGSRMRCWISAISWLPS